METKNGKNRKPRRDPLTARKVGAYAVAKFGGKASEALAAARMKICGRCPRLVKWQGEFYCDSCGCGDRGDARLQIKTAMLRAKCPLEKWPVDVGGNPDKNVDDRLTKAR